MEAERVNLFEIKKFVESDLEDQEEKLEKFVFFQWEIFLNENSKKIFGETLRKNFMKLFEEKSRKTFKKLSKKNSRKNFMNFL